MRRFDAALVQASSQADAFLAPKHLAEATRLYGLAATELKNGREAQAVDYAKQGLKATADAVAAMQQVRQTLGDALEARRQALQLDPAMASRTAEAERMMRTAAATAEAGNEADARRSAQAAADAYATAAATYLKEVRIPDIQAQLSGLRDRLPAADSERARVEIRRVTATLDNVSAGRLSQVIAEVGGLIGVLYPPFFRNPPSTLQMGGFTLHVLSYTRKDWNFASNVINNASGTAWLTFQCSRRFPHPFANTLTFEKELRVVEAVRNPFEEIGVVEARQFNSDIAAGASLKLNIPAFATTSERVAQAVRDLIEFEVKPLGAITVQFDNLTIKQGATPDTGIVSAGTATYPANPTDTPTATLAVAGFTVHLQKIGLTSTGANAAIILEMPSSIIDPGTGHPGRVDLGSLAISPTCVFRTELAAAAYGPWAVGNTEIQVQGTGVVADFDPNWTPAGAPAGSPAASPSWRGALLGGGATLPAQEPITSNSGYLRAQYTYPNALVAAAGLAAQFSLAKPFEFRSLQPLDYLVRLSTGQLTLADSAVTDGTFDAGPLALPERAVRDSTGGRVAAAHGQLGLNAALDLEGSATLNSAIRWGEYSQHNPSSATFFEARGFSFSRFYLSGTNRSNYAPVDSTDQFVEPNAVIVSPAIAGMQGLTTFFPQQLVVDTPDTPGKNPLAFVSTNRANRLTADWLNFSFAGVHGRMQNLVSDRSSKTDLGPTYQPFYVGKQPFVAGSASGSKDRQPTPYTLTIRFVSSAVRDSDMKGALHIPKPVDDDLDFASMAFTSIAQISGAKVPFTNPLNLSYWGLSMVKKPGFASGGVISVRTGQVFFTAAGISEPRHFIMPFYLVWGEMLANGQLRRLDFDYNAAGQKFDQFRYVAAFVSLSNYDPNQPNLPAYLKTAGTVSLDMFGAKYVNLNDGYDPSKTSDPFNTRVVTLANDTDPGGAFRATDHKLHADWSSGFGVMDFTYDYDTAAQNGFVGTGTMGFQWIDQALSASIVIRPERSCMSANDTTRHDFTLGPVARFGAMSRVTGCGCIVNNQLERVMLSAELETDADANIAVRSAGYVGVEWNMTPGITTMALQGDMYLSILAGGNIEVKGSATFTVNRNSDFVEGDVDGAFDADTALGLGNVTANGHLNWHLGTLTGTGYQTLQGQVSTSVMIPGAGGSAEGGFYVGINSPKAEAWVLQAGGPRYGLNTAALPDRLNGLFGYVRFGNSVSLYIVSGGYEVYAGLGGFVLTPQQAVNLGAQSTANVVGLPYVIGNVGAHIWGDILGGLVSADGWADFQIILPYPLQFQGTLGLEGCALWVACETVDVTVGLNSSQGFYLE